MCSFVTDPDNGDKPLDKLVQLNLAEMTHLLCSQHYGLPARGMLSFFSITDDMDPEQMKVRDKEEDNNQL